jgi:hypothetical protein
MSTEFGKGKVLFKTKGFDEAEKKHNAKLRALRNKKEGTKFYSYQMKHHGGFPKSEIEKAEHYEKKHNL